MKDSLFRPSLSYAFGVMYRATEHSPYRYVGIASFCHEPRTSEIVVVGGFIVKVDTFDNDGFMMVSGTNLPATSA